MSYNNMINLNTQELLKYLKEELRPLSITDPGVTFTPAMDRDGYYLVAFCYKSDKILESRCFIPSKSVMMGHTIADKFKECVEQLKELATTDKVL